jgi:hypothetical protein
MSLSGTSKGVYFAMNGGMQPFRAALPQWHGEKRVFFLAFKLPRELIVPWRKAD